MTKAKKPRPDKTPRAFIRSALRQYIWLRCYERLAALKRDKYTCVHCAAKQSKAKGREVKVQVHHKNGIDWDGVIDIIIERVLQTMDDLETICENCHDEEHACDYEIEAPLDPRDHEERSVTENMLMFPKDSTPLPFQIEGVKFALNRQGAMIADEMGLGKTVQAIGVINLIKAFPRVLIICPAVSKYSWEEEIIKWRTYYYVPVVIEKATGIDFTAGDVFIINFDILKDFHTELTSAGWDLVIVDEFHNLRNIDSKRSKTAFAIRARRRLYLSGTPIPNMVKNLWAVLRSLDPLWGSYKDFTREFCGAFWDKEERKWWDNGATNLDKLHNRLKPFMIRRTADEVLNLPPLTSEVIPIPADEESRELAKEIMEHGRELAALKRSADIKAMKALTKITDNQIAKYRKIAGRTKLPWVLKRAEALLAAGEKVVIFAYHRDITQAIYKHFKERAVLVIGGVNSKDKKEAERRFQTDPTCRIFVGNIESAGVTLTLTAACKMLFAEIDWCPDRVLQSTKRCHRIGQTRPVHIEFAVLNDSIDVNMARSVDRKMKAIKTVLDGVEPEWTDLLFDNGETDERRTETTALEGI